MELRAVWKHVGLSGFQHGALLEVTQFHTGITSLQTQCKSYLESLLSCHCKLMIFFFLG